MILRWVPDDVSVTRDDRSAFADGVVDGARNPNQAHFLRRWLSEVRYPDSKPSFAAMISSEDGNRWIRPSVHSDSDEVRWTVYGPDGQAVENIDTPSDLEVLDVDATPLVAKRTDEFDVETVLS
jgi:hypothetical protein